MPQIPIIVPLIVVGLAFGGTMRSKSSRISKRKLASASLAAGLLNSVHAYLLYMLAPTQTAPRVTEVLTGAPLMEGLGSASEEAFVAASFLAALLMVLLVLGIAMAYVRIRRGGEPAEALEQTSETEPALTPN